MGQTESAAHPLFQASFYFLRHGETETNRLELTAGATDVPLNATGWRQARSAAESLKGRGIATLYASPLRRARDTAACVAEALDLQVVIVPELAERSWGELEGKPRELRVREIAPPGGEDLAAFERRTLAGLAKISGGAAPLIVAHSGTFRVLCGRLRLPAPVGQIENGRPLRLVPPATAGGPWIIEPL